MVLPDSRIEVFEQGARLRQVPEFQEEVMLDRERSAMLDESRLRVAGFGGVGVEAVNRALDVKLREPDARETRVPGVEAIPPLAGRVVPHIPPLRVNRI